LADCAAPQTLRLFEVANPGLERCKVIYRAKLKTEGLAGRAIWKCGASSQPGRGVFAGAG